MLDKLPQEIQDKIFLYLDHEDLKKCREMQSDYVKEITESNNYEDAIRRRNSKNVLRLFKLGIPLEKSDTACSVDEDFGCSNLLCLCLDPSCLSLANLPKKIKKLFLRYDISFIRFLISLGCKPDCHVLLHACALGNYSIMKMLIGAGARWEPYIAEKLAVLRKMKCLKYLHNLGYEWNK